MKHLLYILLLMPLLMQGQTLMLNNNYFQITNAGIKLNGTATQYDDVVFPATQTRVNPATSLPALSLDSLYLLFVHDTDSSEKAYYSIQLPHRAKRTYVYPHIHWIQRANADTTWNLRLKYRIHSIGSVSGTWQYVNISDRNELTFTANPFHQVAEWPAISISTSMESTYIDFVVYRYDNVGLAELDVKGFDVHIEVEKLGTDNEYPTP